MPKSLPMLPELTEFVGTELTYVMENSGAPDRDKKATLETIRRFCTAQGVRLLDVTLGVPGTATTIDVTGTTNVVVIAWGRFPNPTDNRLNVTGTIPEGCYATVINGHFGLVDLSINGNELTDTPEGLDFGTLGRAELTSRDGQFVISVFNDSRWNKMRMDAAILVETTRAQSAEGALTDMILGEASQRQDDITETQALISAEVGRAEAAEAEIRDHRAHIVPQTVTLWTNTDIYSQDNGAITVRGPVTGSPGGIAVTGDNNKVIDTAESELIPFGDVWCWRPTGTSGPIIGGGADTNILTTKWQLGMVAAKPISVTGGSPLSRIAMLQWHRALGKIVVEKLPTSTVENPAITVGLLLPTPDTERFEELLVRIVVADDVSCEVVVQHPSNGHGLKVPAATINDGRNWWVRARHEVGGEWKIDCWWEPKRL